jgi:Glycosyltransferase family 6
VKPYATLISFGTGEVFARYLRQMFESAELNFFPGRAELLALDTVPVWPYSVRDRHSVVLQNRRRIRGEFVLFLDADMLFEDLVADEIIADGITAVGHPCMPAGTPADQLTYERDPESAAYIPYGQGHRYYYGALIGGPYATFLDYSAQVDAMCRADGDYCPVWQDESYLNRILLDHPPALELDGRYCAWWTQFAGDTRIRVLEKTPEEFHSRNQLGKEAVTA